MNGMEMAPTESGGRLPGGKPTDAWAMLLPPGWARFPTNEGRRRELDDAIEQVVAQALPDSMPRDKAEPHRRMLRDELRQNLTEAGDAGTGTVYLPIEPMEGVVVPGSIAEIEIVSDAGREAHEVVASVLAGDYEKSDPVEIDGRPAVRVVSTRHEVQRGPDWPEVSTRQVMYVISRDEAAGEWLVMSFSTVWNNEKNELLAETMVLFFDAVMTTFRWAGPGANPIGNLPDATVPGSSAPRA